MNCCCRISCAVISAVASAVLGIITALLTITAAITVTPAFLWTLFGIAVGYLAVTLASTLTAPCCERRRCLCARSGLFLTGALGTILTSVILLGITFAATSFIGAIITGLLIFFFSLLVTSTSCIIRCLACAEE